MMKKLITFIIICIIIVLIKYNYSNYEITYKIKNYDIYTKLENGRIYFEINNDIKYNFDIYTNKRRKVFIHDIKEIELSNYKCIYPIVKKYQTYPLCYDIENNINIDYNLIDDENLEIYKTKEKNVSKPEKDFMYYNNLSDNEYVALWTYKGYIIMNGNEYKNIPIFEKDRYDNDLAYLLKDTIYMPNYDEKYEYSELVLLNITNEKISKLKLNKKIDYDSYIVGNVKHKLYIFDNKHSILYEINTKSEEVKIISSSEIGYYKYENGKFVKCSKSEYKVNKVTFNNESSNYTYQIDNESYKIIKENNLIKTKISDKKIKKIFERENKLYYILDNSFYKYDPSNGSILIFYDYELNFNNTKNVFMYYK